MGHDDSKSYQLRVRITAEERSLLDALRLKRDRGETLSDLVREAIALLVNPHANTGENVQRPQIRAHVERLAELLNRQPGQVEESCIEGILDLIERKCEVPLIVMETQLHLKYRGKNDKSDYPWNAPAEVQPNPAPVEPAS